MQTVRKHPLVETLAEHYPKKATLYDGNTVKVPRRVSHLINHWQQDPIFDRESRQSYAAYNGGDFLDIGAFHGWYSYLLAPKAGEGDRFISFEPDRAAWEPLLFNLSALSKLFPNLTAVPVSVPIGNGASVAVNFPCLPNGEGGGHPQFLSNGEVSTSEVSTSTVDALVNEMSLSPTFIKVDVEGAELGVLEGMEHTLARFHPTVMLEIHPLWLPDEIKVADVQNVMTAHGYSATDLEVSDVVIRQLWA